MKYLALGDSYTIGELVPSRQNFPNQVVNFIEAKGTTVEELKIIATTGWTTDELIGPMETQIKHHTYNWVTVLIGVNNQYRSRSVTEYTIHLQYILNRATTFANGNAGNVIVLSIPDWGLTPFNKDRDSIGISKEINAYNNVKKELAAKLGMQYIDITESTRKHAKDSNYLAPDLLHPGAKEYAIWAELVFDIMNNG